MHRCIHINSTSSSETVVTVFCTLHVLCGKLVSYFIRKVGYVCAEGQIRSIYEGIYEKMAYFRANSVIINKKHVFVTVFTNDKEQGAIIFFKVDANAGP